MINPKQPASRHKRDRSDSERMADLLRWCAEQTEALPPLTFMERCNETTALIKELRSLRKSAMRIGFEPLSFGQYVERVAYAAGVAIQPILRVLGIKTAEGTSGLDDVSSGLVRLAVGMGIPSRQFIIHLKLGALAKAGLPSVQFARLQEQTEDKARLMALIEEDIREVERKTAPSFLKNTRILEKQVIHLYREFLN